MVDLDPNPTSLLKQCSSVLPKITNIINLSLSTSIFPNQTKNCSVHPHLKKPIVLIRKISQTIVPYLIYLIYLNLLKELSKPVSRYIHLITSSSLQPFSVSQTQPTSKIIPLKLLDCRSANKVINDSRKNLFRRKLQVCCDDPGGAGTSSLRKFFILHQATIAVPMPRIVCFIILSLTFFPPKCSILNYLSRLNSAVFHHPFYSLTHLADSTLYSLPPVTPSAVFKILNTFEIFFSGLLALLPS